jgi:hypothetical protein
VLERGRGVAESEWHNLGFEKSLLHFDCYDLLAIGVDSNVVVSVPDIEFRHEFGVLHLIEYYVDSGQGVHIGDGPLVHLLIIVNWLTFVHSYVEERTGPW